MMQMYNRLAPTGAGEKSDLLRLLNKKMNALADKFFTPGDCAVGIRLDHARNDAGSFRQSCTCEIDVRARSGGTHVTVERVRGTLLEAIDAAGNALSAILQKEGRLKARVRRRHPARAVSSG